MPKNKEQVDIKTLIKKSGLFDKNFYLKTYRDVRLADITPLEHYIQKGMKEDRKPNEHFDPIWYREFYTDVKEDESYPFIHYILFGRDENRFVNEKESNPDKDIEDTEDEYSDEELEYYEKLQKNGFDLEFYKNYYEDLEAIDDENFDLLFHYIRYGEKEHRSISFIDLLKSRNFNDEIIIKLNRYLKNDFYKTLQSFNTIDINMKSFIDNITGINFNPLKISNNNIINSEFYLLLAENFLIMKNISVADKYLNLSLYFAKNHKVLEYKGNINFEHQNYKDAILYYKEALSLNKQLKFVYENLAVCYENLNDLENAIDTLLEGVLAIPTSAEHYKQKISFLLEEYYQEKKHSYYNNYLINQDRTMLLNSINDVTKYTYETYFKLYKGEDKLEEYNTINKKNVLIIADYHVEQCVRYRIDQKVEQLEAQNYNVETIDWTKLHEKEDIVPFFDIVIFYRVPSRVNIIKTLAKVNALNKISIYEIDDLLFDPIYPDDIKNYGGNVDIDAYHSLTLGMTKMNSIAKLCQYGMASTIPLQEKLQSIVSKKVCLLHRNGLDSFSTVSEIEKANKNTIDLFYGSGTLAHNQDFIDLVVPALERLFKEFKHLRMVIVGHLTLPKKFLDKYTKQVVTLPKVNIKAYYNYLKQADINLAVLHKDEITDTKSELKWFEAGCFYIPSIVSGTQNYLDVIKEGEDGFIANTPEEWYINIKQLIEDKTLRKNIGSNVAKRIKDEYSIESLGLELSENLNLLVDKNYTKRDKKRKKIALVNVFFPPESIGGATRVVADNFDLLIDKYKDEYEICVFTSEIECLEPYKMSAYNYKGARVYKANILYREHMDWHPQDENMYDLFTKFLELEAPDKVHFHCVQRLTASIVEATKDMKIPYIITAHDAWWISDHQFLVDKNDKVYPDGHPDPFYKRVLNENMTLDMSIERSAYLKSLLLDAQHILTVSESFADIYRKNGIPDIKVTKNGISSKIKWLEKDTSNTQKVVCGHIGGMSSHKGFDILKKAVIKLQPENQEYLIVDHSKDEGYISFEKWGEVDVKFIGRQNQDEMVALYSKIDVLFAPSIWPESFGLVTREAAACGCWIVASNLGGIGEDVSDGENGFVIEPTQTAIENTLEEIDKDWIRYKSLAPKGNVSIVEEQVKSLEKFLND
ncbi:glycosyltransferase [Poseidonibacter lekithochrous]|uniref:glycosyltransferase n=1 Tax=Poseidonibacter TaxID=2321187 RepID=UPI001C097684|nr:MULTISPECIES: glycosyltransferase [Poseidonibacter]MBU3014062.1 glycosyltransferase [Poseidonibacter lekithochrous]MDO6827359.1 glycosyltransferase [Poseidonibacter sp. 1_MG-2023]